MDNDPQPRAFAPTSRLNFVIGLSAMAVSLASLYATFLQAGSAEQQVKAMTYPLVQYTTGNYDVESKEQALTLRLSNNGVGPAIIRSTRYSYEGQELKSVYDFIQACCSEAFERYRDLAQNPESDSGVAIVTSMDRNVILPANEEMAILYLLRQPESAELWDRLNEERRRLAVTVCYCSLLDECYESPAPAQVNEVAACPLP